MKKTSVLIADDHSLLRMGLRSMLRQEADMEVVGEAVNGEMAVELVRKLKPDVVVMDLMMPKLNGADATRSILERNPDTKVIILTSFGTSSDLQRAISYGAVGALTKEAPGENLVKAIRQVRAGETAISAEIADEIDPDSAQPLLTDKQSDILQSVVQGQTNRQIAVRFGITEDGVKKHLRLIFTKLNASSRAEAVAIALRKHLLKI
ncbi:MAG: response regulator transcription factor [bacterium]|nr:response regulator transcription factor [Candidatus Colisoma equi]